VTADAAQGGDETAALWGVRDARAHLEALATCLRAYGLEAKMTGRGRLLVANPDRASSCTEAGRGRLADTVSCRPRPTDEWRPWFFTSWDEPIAPVDQAADAVITIIGYLRDQGPKPLSGDSS
jgi:hypothetical protein